MVASLGEVPDHCTKDLHHCNIILDHSSSKWLQSISLRSNWGRFVMKEYPFVFNIDTWKDRPRWPLASFCNLGSYVLKRSTTTNITVNVPDFGSPSIKINGISSWMNYPFETSLIVESLDSIHIYPKILGPQDAVHFLVWFPYNCIDNNRHFLLISWSTQRL